METEYKLFVPKHRLHLQTREPFLR